MPKKDPLESPLPNPSDKPEPTRKPREKKVEYQGSRWSSLIVLLLLIAIGLILSVTAQP